MQTKFDVPVQHQNNIETRMTRATGEAETDLILFLQDELATCLRKAPRACFADTAAGACTVRLGISSKATVAHSISRPAPQSLRFSRPLELID